MTLASPAFTSRFSPDCAGSLYLRGSTTAGFVRSGVSGASDAIVTRYWPLAAPFSVAAEVHVGREHDRAAR
jgi:hypothetical protein